MTCLLSAIAILACAVCNPLTAKAAENDANGEPRGIVAVRENGKTVYVNAPDAPSPARTRARTVPRRTSFLVYWSAKERRWKPVPSPTPSAMYAARNAAADVANYVGSQPVASRRTRTVSNPNYRNLARGRKVTSAEIDRAIDKAAKKHGVDPNLVRAMIKVESNFNPEAVSRKGAMGLMQLMPETARSLNVTNPFDPSQNVDAGVRYFKNLMKNYDGDVRLSLAAYNAGAGAVARSNGVPRIPETQNYVKQITNMYWNGKTVGKFDSNGTPSGAPARMFRGADGRIVITNQDQ